MIKFLWTHKWRMLFWLVINLWISPWGIFLGIIHFGILVCLEPWKRKKARGEWDESVAEKLSEDETKRHQNNRALALAFWLREKHSLSVTEAATIAESVVEFEEKA